MRSTPAAPALLVLALLVAAAGCAEDSTDAGPAVAADPTPTSTPEPSAPETSTPEPSTEAPEESEVPFPDDVGPVDGGYGSGNGLGLVGVRSSQGPDYDRVVFDLGGTGTPGWYVDYVRRPRFDGSGKPVPLEGEVYLQVGLRGMGLPFDTGLTPYGDDTTRVPGTGTRGVVEIAPGGVFEGDQLAWIGLTGAERPFRVFALSNPTRVVVDVLHG